MSVEVQQKEKVENLLTMISATARAFSFYPEGHHIPASFLDNLHKSFELFFADRDRLTIQVKRGGFIYQDTALSTDNATVARMANLLIAIKVIQIDFLQDLRKSELKTLGRALALAPEDIILAGGLSSVLGKDKVPNVEIEELSFKDAERAAIEQKKVQKNKNQRYPFAYCPIPIKPQENAPQTPDGEKAQVKLASASLSEIAKAATMTSSFGELVIEGDPQLMEATASEDIALTLLNLLREEAERPLFIDTAGLLRDTLATLCDAGQIDVVIGVMERLNDIRRGSAKEGWRIDSLAAVFKSLGKHKAIKTMVSYLADRGIEDRDVKVLLLLGRDALRQTIELLAIEEDMKKRRQLISLLKKICSGNLNLLTTYLTDSRWYFVRNLVDIIGHVGGEKAVPYVTRTLAHPHQQVRLSCLRALYMIGNPEAFRQITRYLSMERDTKLRKMAVSLLGESEAAVDALERIVENRNFKQDNLEIKEEAVNALATIGTPEARAALKKLARRRHLFRRKRWKQLQALARDFLADRKASQDAIQNRQAKERGIHA